MPDSADQLARIRQRIARIEQRLAGTPDRSSALPASGLSADTRLTLGPEEIDGLLGGGLRRAALHELFAAEPGDAGSAAGFAAMLGCRSNGPLVWLRCDGAERAAGRLHPPGLGAIGLDPARLVLALLPDPLALLRAALDVLRCAETGLAVIELWQAPPRLDLTATRRLARAAAGSGATALLLRIDAVPMPSAADTRWQVAAAPSRPHGAAAPGSPALSLTLLRQRGGPAGQQWDLEWDRDDAEFRRIEPIVRPEAEPRPAPVPGLVLPLAERRSVRDRGAGRDAGRGEPGRRRA